MVAAAIWNSRTLHSADVTQVCGISKKSAGRKRPQADAHHWRHAQDRSVNTDNVAFVSSAVDPNNPAFIYGPGVLPSGGLAPIDPRFLRLRTASGGYDSAATAQQGTPFQAQLGLRLVF